MIALRDAAAEFLAQRRIAVAGVSRDGKQPANLIYRRLRECGHNVFAVNPSAQELEGDPAFAGVSAIPSGVDGVVIVTTPLAADAVVADCVSAGVPRVWFHRGIGRGSVSESAISYCREHGISVIAGGCPNMFGAGSDPAHRGMCALLTLAGKIPRRIPDTDYPHTGAQAATR